MVGTEVKGVQEQDQTKFSATEEVAGSGRQWQSAVLRGLRAGLQQTSQQMCRMLECRLSLHSEKFFVSEVVLRML